MKITWLGQAGLLFQGPAVTVMVDPYFSDSVRRIDPKNHRRIPLNEKFLHIIPDILVFTHNHLDHYDPETVKPILSSEKPITVLAPSSVWAEVRKFGGAHNYVLFDRHTQWSQAGMRFTAVKAAHSDPWAIGVVLEDGGKRYYITGDTLYNTEIFEDISEDIDVVFLPVNGAGNNMNMEDAARFCCRLGAKVAVPVHCGMFDSINMNAFGHEPKIVPVVYKEIAL